jgi:hypothetical protein
VWVSESDYNYPADFTRIKSAVVKIAELKIGQVVEAEAGDKAAMKMVSPVDSPDGGTLIEMSDAGGTRLSALLIGETRKRTGGAQGRFGGYPDGQFVSPDGGDTVYLVTDNLYEFNRGADWLEKELVSVPATEVASVRISGPERDSLELSVAEGGSDLVLAELGKEEEMDIASANSIKSALSYLRFESVADPSLSDEDLGLDTPVTFVATTMKGEIYTVQIGAKAPDSDDRYARIRVALAPAAEDEEPTGEEELTDEEKQAAAEEKTRQAEERAQQELKVAELNAKLGPWTYTLGSYKSDTMLSTREQVVKAIEEEEEVTDES